MIEEARDRNRASAALAAGQAVLMGGPAPISAPTAPVPIVAPPPTPGNPTMEQLMATIALLQAQLQLQTIETNPPAPGTIQGVPPAIQVPTIAGPGGLPVPGPPATVVPAPPAAPHHVTTPTPVSTLGGPLVLTPGPFPPPVVTTAAPAGNASVPVPSVVGPVTPPAVGAVIPTGSAVTFSPGTSGGPTVAPPTPPSISTTTKWYVIVAGKSPGDTGVYASWAQVAPLVNGVPGAIFKGGFRTKVEADSYLANAVGISVVSSPSRRKTWHAISVGRDPEDRGVYDSWPEVASRIGGVSGAIYKSGFQTKDEAELFLARSHAPPPQQLTPTQAQHARPPIQPSPTPMTPQGSTLGGYPGSHQSGQATHGSTPPVPGYPSPGAFGHQSSAPPGPYGGAPSATPNPYVPTPAPPSPYQGTYGSVPYGGTSTQGPHTPMPPQPGTGYGGPPSPSPSPSPYGHGYGQAPVTPQTGPTGTSHMPAYGPTPTQPAGTWALPQRLVGPDPSAGQKGELWHAKAGEDLTMLQAWCPPGLTLERQVQLGDQTLDAVGLPGTSSQGSDEFDLARLSDALVMMATGRGSATNSLLQGAVDTAFKKDSRTTLGSIKNLRDLEHRMQALTSNQHKVMEHVETNLKIVLMGGGYTAVDAALLAHDSPFLRISSDSQSAYLGLHMHLLGVGLQSGWEHLKTELQYHVRKLKEIRALHQTRLQVVAHNYCYLRDLQSHKWQTFGIQDLRIREIQMNLAGLGPLNPSPPQGGGNPLAMPGRVHFCNHCKTSLHPGNKGSCFWKGLSAGAAKKEGANAARRLGAGDSPLGPGDPIEEIP
jgi:hypothetical protein